MAFRRLLLSLLLLSVACKKSKDESTSNSCSAKVVSSKIIIGNNDWVLLTNVGIPAQTGNGRAVAQIKIPAISATCTGFLINSDTIMTNNHCVSGSGSAPGVTATFRYENQPKETFACDQFIMTDMVYDFTLLKCKNSPGTKYGWVGLSSSKPALNSEIYVIQENCDYIQDIHCTIDKYIAYGDILDVGTYQVSHNADTLPGSSGSPIFSGSSNQVIALHNAGGSNGGQPTNFGVPMSAIRSKILASSGVTIYDQGTYANSSSGGSTSGGTTGSSPGIPSSPSTTNTSPISSDGGGGSGC